MPEAELTVTLTMDRLQEKAQYLNTTKDVGNRRLDFRFAH